MLWAEPKVLFLGRKVGEGFACLLWNGLWRWNCDGKKSTEEILLIIMLILYDNKVWRTSGRKRRNSLTTLQSSMKQSLKSFFRKLCSSMEKCLSPKVWWKYRTDQPLSSWVKSVQYAGRWKIQIGAWLRWGAGHNLFFLYFELFCYVGRFFPFKRNYTYKN